MMNMYTTVRIFILLMLVGVSANGINRNAAAIDQGRFIAFQQKKLKTIRAELIRLTAEKNYWETQLRLWRYAPGNMNKKNTITRKITSLERQQKRIEKTIEDASFQDR